MRTRKQEIKHRRRMRKLRNRLLIGVTVMAGLTFVGTAFYVDSQYWQMSDLFWQIPVWAVCYIWMILFILSNNRQKDAEAKKRLIKGLPKAC